MKVGFRGGKINSCGRQQHASSGAAGMMIFKANPNRILKARVQLVDKIYDN